MFKPEEIEEKKRLFAGALLIFPAIGDSGKAAAMVESRAAHAFYMAEQWPVDPEVMSYLAELRNGGGISAALPTKEQFSFAIWAAANSCYDSDTKLKYLELCAKVMSFIEKPPTTVVNNNNNNSDNRRVMIMPPHSTSLEELEIEITDQQAKLINASGI